MSPTNDLVPQWRQRIRLWSTTDCWTPNKLSNIDAIFVSTRGRPEYVSSTISMLSNCIVKHKIWILPTSEMDIPVSCNSYMTPSANESQEFDFIWDSLQSTSTIIGSYYNQIWDLPKKRCFAIWLASRHGLSKLLLVDDDIRKLDIDHTRRIASLLDKYDICGPFTNKMIDTSTIGHAIIASGLALESFFSGNCLGINIKRLHPFFPPIYNEDWLAILPAIQTKKIVCTGFVSQMEYDPFKCSSIARFQEYGEIFCDGIYYLMSTFQIQGNLRNLYDFSIPGSSSMINASQKEFWIERTQVRMMMIEYLLRQNFADMRIVQSLKASLSICSYCKAEDLQDFFTAWVLDTRTWQQTVSDNFLISNRAD